MSNAPVTPILRPADHAFFLEKGFVILKNAVPPPIIAAAVAALEGGEFTGHVGAADYQPVRAAAIDACVSEQVLQAIGELFGPSYPFERRQHAVDMPRPHEAGKEWTHQTVHVDDDYPTLMPGGWALGMFIFLTPVRPQGGAFLYAPGSPYLYRPLMADNPEWPSFYTARPEVAGTAVEYLAQPGDVLLFHHLMAHAGSSNVSDARTRHALLARWHPHRRIVPGDKPLGEMSTIEKANSTRFLHEGHTTAPPVPTVPAHAIETLRGGLSLTGDIRAHATIRYEGVTHIFSVAADRVTIRHTRSQDWAAWEADAPVQGGDGPICSLSLFRQDKQILLFVGTDSSAPRTQILTSTDLRTWAPVATLDGMRGAAGHTTTDYGSKQARGNVAVGVSGAAAGTIQARWGTAWPDAAAWPDTTTAALAPPGATVVDAFVKPILGESEFALVADVHEGSATRPFYARSHDSVDYGSALQPLSFSAPAAPHSLRVYARARLYWLVTYTRQQAGGERLFWGTIDWEREEPVLEEIDSVEALRQALAVVGII